MGSVVGEGEAPALGAAKGHESGVTADVAFGQAAVTGTPLPDSSACPSIVTSPSRTRASSTFCAHSTCGSHENADLPEQFPGGPDNPADLSIGHTEAVFWEPSGAGADILDAAPSTQDT